MLLSPGGSCSPACPTMSHHVPAGPGGELPVPSWGSGTLLLFVSGEWWSTGTKRQQNHDSFVLPVQGWVQEMETALTCVRVTVEHALSLGKEHGDDIEVPMVPWESQQCADIPETLLGPVEWWRQLRVIAHTPVAPTALAEAAGSRASLFTELMK